MQNVNGGMVSGMVIVRLLGLVDNATSAPAAVLVDTFPAGLTNLAASIAMPGVSSATAYTNPAILHAAITTAGGRFADGEAFYELVYDTHASPTQLVLSINGQSKFNYPYFREGGRNTFLNVGNEQGPASISLTPVREPQNRRLVRRPVVLAAEPCKVTGQRHIVQRIFHRRIAQVEPLLHEVDAQHRLDEKRRTTATAFGHVRRDQPNQVRPRHHALHLAQKLPLSRSLRRLAETQALLLHDRHRLIGSHDGQAHRRRAFAERP